MDDVCVLFRRERLEWMPRLSGRDCPVRTLRITPVDCLGRGIVDIEHFARDVIPGDLEYEEGVSGNPQVAESFQYSQAQGRRRFFVGLLCWESWE